MHAIIIFSTLTIKVRNVSHYPCGQASRRGIPAVSKTRRILASSLHVWTSAEDSNVWQWRGQTLLSACTRISSSIRRWLGRERRRACLSWSTSHSLAYRRRIRACLWSRKEWSELGTSLILSFAFLCPFFISGLFWMLKGSKMNRI